MMERSVTDFFAVVASKQRKIASYLHHGQDAAGDVSRVNLLNVLNNR